MRFKLLCTPDFLFSFLYNISASLLSFTVCPVILNTIQFLYYNVIFFLLENISCLSRSLSWVTPMSQGWFPLDLTSWGRFLEFPTLLCCSFSCARWTPAARCLFILCLCTEWQALCNITYSVSSSYSYHLPCEFSHNLITLPYILETDPYGLYQWAFLYGFLLASAEGIPCHMIRRRVRMEFWGLIPSSGLPWLIASLQ